MPTTTKTVYIYGAGLANATSCSNVNPATIDAAAQVGGWFTLPNGYRVNWDRVTLYLFQ